MHCCTGGHEGEPLQVTDNDDLCVPFDSMTAPLLQLVVEENSGGDSTSSSVDSLEPAIQPNLAIES